MTKTGTMNQLSNDQLALTLKAVAEKAQALREAVPKQVNDLSEQLLPLVRTMAYMADEATGQMTELSKAIQVMNSEARIFRGKMSDMSEAITTQMKFFVGKILGIILVAGILSPPLTLSAYSAWENLFSEKTENAHNWVVFKEKFLPRLDKRSQFELDQVLKSSKKR